MKRREFITLLGGAAVAWPLAARAQQQAAMRRIGLLMTGVPTEPTLRSYVAEFAQTLRTMGWVDGQNVRIDYRWNAGNAEQARVNAKEIVALSPEVILVASTTNLRALQATNSTIATVFVQVSDPVAQGFVANLARPAGHITGFSAYEFSMGAKWLDLLRQVAPNVDRIAVMFNPDTSPQSNLFLRSIQAAAPPFGMGVTTSSVHNTAEIEQDVESFSRDPNGGLLLPTDTFTRLHGKLIVELCARYRLPAISAHPEFVRDGGLIHYGIDGVEPYRQAASYVDRILKGTKPGDLPIQQPTKFILAINLKTARALGLDVPLRLQQIADEVIE
jgi:putative ABC transport system substrate-binding protein